MTYFMESLWFMLRHPMRWFRYMRSAWAIVRQESDPHETDDAAADERCRRRVSELRHSYGLRKFNSGP